MDADAAGLCSLATIGFSERQQQITYHTTPKIHLSSIIILFEWDYIDSPCSQSFFNSHLALLVCSNFRHSKSFTKRTAKPREISYSFAEDGSERKTRVEGISIKKGELHFSSRVPLHWSPNPKNGLSHAVWLYLTQELDRWLKGF